MAYAIAPAPAGHSSSPELLQLFHDQLAWLIGGAQDTKRVLTGWLLASPPPPQGPGLTLAHVRATTTRHLNQLEQLLAGLQLPTEPVTGNQVIEPLWQAGEACLRTLEPDAQRFGALMRIVQRLCVGFGTACASTAETAIVLGRIDVAAVLSSWAAAWRELQDSLSEAYQAQVELARGPDVGGSTAS